MRKHQFGVSLMALILGSVVLIAIAMIGLKLAHSYLEFMNIKKAVVSIAAEKGGGSVADIRKAFDARAAVDDITTIKGSDLEVTKEGGQIVINAAFRKEIPLVGNM